MPRPDLPPMLADPAQVEQALFNLTNNAIHAIHNGMHSGGKITIRARLALPDLGLVQRFDLQPDDYIALTVQDNGPGMDAATQERIFEPFFTTKPVGQGTGLGLAVVHGLMRTHEGAVEVHSHPGQGCTFTLYFPLLPASTAANFYRPRLQRVKPLESAALPVTLHSAPQMQHHVMYVDDDAAMVHLVQRLLRRRGYQITTFEDPGRPSRLCTLRPTPLIWWSPTTTCPVTAVWTCSKRPSRFARFARGPGLGLRHLGNQRAGPGRRGFGPDSQTQRCQRVVRHRGSAFAPQYPCHHRLA